MRIVSLLPSATEIIAGLGLTESSVGRSNECTYPPEVARLPVVTAARIDPRELESVEIDRQVRAAIADGRSLYAVDAALIDELRPGRDRHPGPVRGVRRQLGRARVGLPGRRHRDLARPVHARRGRGIDRDARDAARRAGAGEGGRRRDARTIDDVRRSTEAALDAGARRPRVFVAEWIDPPFVPGHWLPGMIEAAGGEALLAEPGRPSHPTTWDEVSAADPELLVIAPCGFDAAEAARRAAHLDLERIAPNARVVVVDGDAYYSRPGPRLADGVRQLGHLLHPDAVPDPGLPLIELRRARAVAA